MMAGYSGTPLPKKLGLKPGMRVFFDGAPDAIVDDIVGPEVELLRRIGKDLDYIHLFTDSTARLRARFPKLRDATAKDGMVWVSWPKKASGIDTDLSGDIVRNMGLSFGLVDVKVCAVDETWSGLKFVWRTKDR